jgi:hypothetical protein
MKCSNKVLYYPSPFIIPPSLYMHVPKYYLPLTEAIVIYCCVQHVILDWNMSPPLPAPPPSSPLPKFQSTAVAAVKHSIKKDLISVLECRLGNCLSSFNQVNGAARPWIFNGHIHGLCAYTDIFKRARVALYIATSSAFRFYIRVYVSYNRYSVLLHSYFSSSFHALNLEI